MYYKHTSNSSCFGLERLARLERVQFSSVVARIFHLSDQFNPHETITFNGRPLQHCHQQPTPDWVSVLEINFSDNL